MRAYSKKQHWTQRPENQLKLMNAHLKGKSTKRRNSKRFTALPQTEKPLISTTDASRVLISAASGFHHAGEHDKVAKVLATLELLWSV